MKDEKTQVQPDQSPAVQVATEASVARGVYANLVLIGNQPEEVVFDFVFRAREENHLVSRVILSHKHADRLLAALAKNVERRRDADKLGAGQEAQTPPLVTPPASRKARKTRS